MLPHPLITMLHQSYLTRSVEHLVLDVPHFEHSLEQAVETVGVGGCPTGGADG